MLKRHKILQCDIVDVDTSPNHVVCPIPNALVKLTSFCLVPADNVGK